MGEKRKTAIVLINTGSPCSPEMADIRRYLRQFLGDPRIIDLPWILRFLLVNLIIVPRRSAQSSLVYRKIWTEAGSPLLVHTEQLSKELERNLAHSGDGKVTVRMAMRYGTPAIADVLEDVLDAAPDKIVLIPLFPQYASATTGSCIEAAYRKIAERRIIPSIATVTSFYDNPLFIQAWAERIAGAIGIDRSDHLLFSFHGLPVKHLHQSEHYLETRCRIDETCCSKQDDANRHCYRAQCYATARGIAAALQLPQDFWSVSFQSRMGKGEWIEPDTATTVAKIARSGILRLAVCCPSFVVDCLETLEEIQTTAKRIFFEAGGTAFNYVPALNDHPRFIEMLVSIVRASLR